MEEKEIEDEHEELWREGVMNCGGQKGVAKTTASSQPASLVVSLSPRPNFALSYRIRSVIKSMDNFEYLFICLFVYLKGRTGSACGCGWVENETDFPFSMSFTLTKLGLPLYLQPKALLLVYECGYENESVRRGRGRRRSDGAARDRVIGFGKHKGKMLGSLPSSYLKWVSKNLRAREFEEWAILADQVLEDPVYQDRIQWEFAYNILSGGNKNNTRPHDVVSQLLDISDKFGWDWDNAHAAAWRDVNFELLGTSKGGRIPRRNKPTPTQSQTDTEESKTAEEAGGGGGRRRERRDRLRIKREKFKGVVEKSLTEPTPTPRINHPFPGRKTLLNRFTKTK